MTNLTNSQSKQECSLLRRAAGNNDARGSQEPIFKPITSPGLANDCFFGSVVGLALARGRGIGEFPVPFGVFLGSGAVVALLVGPKIILWYLHRIW